MKFGSLLFTCFSFLTIVEASLVDRIRNALGFPFEKDNLDVNRYIVTFKNKEGRRAGIKAASKFLFELDEINAIVVTLPKAVAEKLNSNANIESIEEDELIAPESSFETTRRLHLEATRPQNVKSSIGGESDNHNRKVHRRLEQVVPYGIPMVEADQVSYAGGRKVCIIDGGYAIDHEDLPKDNVNGFDGRGKSPRPFSILGRVVFVFGSRYLGPWNQYSFGSHAAGIIAALDNDIGVVGVAPGVDLYIVNVVSGDGSGIYTSSVVRALGLCDDAGANIVSLDIYLTEEFTEIDPKFRDSFSRAVNRAYEKGMLLFGVAGDRNSTSYILPGSFDSVISVGAVDESEKIADFSNKNDRVELVAPGVYVLSTEPDTMATSLEVNFTSSSTTEIKSISLIGSANGEAVGQLEYCGLGDGQTPCDPTGKICLIERGGIDFSEKVEFCENKSALATIVYNNLPGLFDGTLGDFQSSKPVLGIAADDGLILRNYTGEARVTSEDSEYSYLDGTGAASAYAAGVAALVWSKHPNCSNEQIREALQKTAKDLGETGKDNSYGYGLVQAKLAVDYLDANACQ